MADDPQADQDQALVLKEPNPRYTHAWDALPGEPATAHAALLKYISLGPKRSVRYTAKIMKGSWKTYERWSLKWDWRQRAEQFDTYRNQQRAKAMVAGVKVSVQHEIKALLDTIEVVMLNAERMKKDFRKDKSQRLGARSHKDLLLTALTLARLYRGQPGEIELQLTVRPEDAFNKLTQIVERVQGLKPGALLSALPAPKAPDREEAMVQCRGGHSWGAAGEWGGSIGSP